MVTEQQKHKQKEPSLLNPGHLVSEGPWNQWEERGRRKWDAVLCPNAGLQIYHTQGHPPHLLIPSTFQEYSISNAKSYPWAQNRAPGLLPAARHLAFPARACSASTRPPVAWGSWAEDLMGTILLSPTSLELPDPFLQALQDTKGQVLASMKQGWGYYLPKHPYPFPVLLEEQCLM